MADKKKKKRINQDIIFLICFFAVVAALSLSFALLNRGTVDPNESGFSGGLEEPEDDENMKRILIVAGIAGAFVIGSVICVKLSERSKKRAAKKAQEKNSQRPLSEREKREMEEMQQIIALGQKTINSRQYHKNYFGREEREYKDDMPDRPRRRYYDYDDYDDLDDEEGTSRKKILIPIAIGAAVLAVAGVVAVVILL